MRLAVDGLAATLAVLLVAVSSNTEAQDAGKRWRIGYLTQEGAPTSRAPLACRSWKAGENEGTSLTRREEGLRRLSRFYLALNLKTAKALGLQVSPALLLRAGQAID